MSKKAKTEAPSSHRPIQGTNFFQGTGVAKGLSVHPKASNHFFDLLWLSSFYPQEHVSSLYFWFFSHLMLKSLAQQGLETAALN